MLYVVCSEYIQLYVLSPFSEVSKSGNRRPTKAQVVPKDSSVNEEQVHESKKVKKWAVYEQPLARKTVCSIYTTVCSTQNIEQILDLYFFNFPIVVPFALRLNKT